MLVVDHMKQFVDGVVKHISVTSAFHLSRHPDIQFPPRRFGSMANCHNFSKFSKCENCSVLQNSTEEKNLHVSASFPIHVVLEVVCVYCACARGQFLIVMDRVMGQSAVCWTNEQKVADWSWVVRASVASIKNSKFPQVSKNVALLFSSSRLVSGSSSQLLKKEETVKKVVPCWLGWLQPSWACIFSALMQSKKVHTWKLY